MNPFKTIIFGKLSDRFRLNVESLDGFILKPKAMSKHIILLIGLFFQGLLFGQNPEMEKIKGGEYIPFYGNGEAVMVESFLMDKYPVSNQEFLEFTKKQARWKKSQVKRLFAEENYLSAWENDTSLGAGQLPNSPVTYVSWYAAKNYCECQGKRLPTTEEWEYAAMAGENAQDSRENKAFNQYILNWYRTPGTHDNPIGENFKNYWGIYDLHGLVWEWTSDFNTNMVSADTRKGTKGDANLFCGAASLESTDLMNYAAFMRFAFRGSLKANYSIKNLGFRCVKDLDAGLYASR